MFIDAPFTLLVAFSVLKSVGTILIFRKPIMSQVNLYLKLRVEEKLRKKEKEGFHYYLSREYKKAIVTYEEVLDLREKHPEAQYVDIASVCASLARVYADKKDFEKAEKMYKKALKIANKKVVKNNAFITNIKKSLLHSIELKEKTPKNS